MKKILFLLLALLIALPVEAKITEFNSPSFSVNAKAKQFTVTYKNKNGDARSLSGPVKEGWENFIYKVIIYDATGFGELKPLKDSNAKVKLPFIMIYDIENDKYSDFGNIKELKSKDDKVKLPYVKILDAATGKYYKASLKEMEPLLIYQIMVRNNFD